MGHFVGQSAAWESEAFRVLVPGAPGVEKTDLVEEVWLKVLVNIGQYWLIMVNNG